MSKLSQSELAELVKVGNYSTRVDELRQNRCALSLIKYGSGRLNFPDKVQALPTAQKCIDKYTDTKNTEFLLDAMNYLMFEFMYPSFSDARFTATDSKDSAGLVGMSVKEIERFKEEEEEENIEY